MLHSSILFTVILLLERPNCARSDYYVELTPDSGHDSGKPPNSLQNFIKCGRKGNCNYVIWHKSGENWTFENNIEMYQSFNGVRIWEKHSGRYHFTSSFILALRRQIQSDRISSTDGHCNMKNITDNAKCSNSKRITRIKSNL